MTGEIKKRVNDMTTINFSITKCPHKVYERFVGFAKSESSDNYSMALKLLLDNQEASAKEEVLFEMFIQQKAELEQLKEQIASKGDVVEEKPKPTAFGKKD